MYCHQCGHLIPDDSSFCTRCGQAVPPATSATQPLAAVPSTVSYAETPQLPVSGEPQTSGKAIASLVLGVLGFILPAAIAAIVLGHMSRAEIRRSAGRLRGAGIALGGLILGYLGLAVIPISIIAAIAIPSLLRARIEANETAAVKSLHTIAIAQVAYANQFPGTGFACELPALGPGTDGTATRDHAGVIDAGLSGGNRYGYAFKITNCGPENDVVRRYRVVATPVKPGVTGRRRFCVDETGYLRYTADANTECDGNSRGLK